MTANDKSSMSNKHIEITKRWLETFVIGLNFCPFAQKPYRLDSIRYVLAEATTVEKLLEELMQELQLLSKTPRTETETTLLIHPQVLTDFHEYNDFLAIADNAVEMLQLDGILQIASFHPDYQFAESLPDAVENYTNRSPYPMLHLLREDSISEAVEHYPNVELIPRRNVSTLRKSGLPSIQRQLDDLTATH